MMINAIAVIGLGFGDEGKGTIVDALCKKHDAHTVVRFNGGAQAAHNVVTSDGRHHTFSQFGSGTFNGARTHLSEYHLFDPVALKKESEALEKLGIIDPLSLVSVASRAPVVSYFSIVINRLKEMHSKNPHGTCGKGIGETMQLAINNPRLTICAWMLNDENALRLKLEDQHAFYFPLLKTLYDTLPREHGSDLFNQATHMVKAFNNIDAIVYNMMHATDTVKILNSTEEYQQVYNRPGTIIFEGAQGALLDEWYGFHPHTTWSTTTFENVDKILSHKDLAEQAINITKMGVIRSYSTRHGRGPFPTHCDNLTTLLPDAENVWNQWQTDWRVGHLDLPLLEYAVKVAKPDCIAVTHMDKFDQIGSVCQSYVAQKKKFQRIPFQKKLNKQNKENLKESEKLTTWVSTKIDKPIIANVASSDALLSMISNVTNIPIAVVSSGKTAKDKTFFNIA